ncbi:hypothetical protein XmelCFBP4644_06640 [Xanthomonas melonis]|uniref:Uncharacterized protein n=1 Tax=Xanthomonas melonis TaxID=56456 RepID=A0A2S7DJU2_9XANT|nr:hypothetical protein XmelCFBP4644_06640 [Xanthomonas melonis]
MLAIEKYYIEGIGTEPLLGFNVFNPFFFSGNSKTNKPYFLLKPEAPPSHVMRNILGMFKL